MNKSMRRLLSTADLQLLRQTEPKRLGGCDEEELVALHRRVRRARNKYSKLHRRQASARVTADRSRGLASRSNQRSAAKAEVFEDALARVSRSLASAARQRARELRDERLEAARSVKGARSRSKGMSGKQRSGTDAGGSSRAKKKQRTPERKRAAASSRASTKRRQAKRDAALTSLSEPVSDGAPADRRASTAAGGARPAGQLSSTVRACPASAAWRATRSS